MRILELGTGLLPAYTGKILADHGHSVTKITENDPFRHDMDLWDWLNKGKKVLEQPLFKLDPIRAADVVIDTMPPDYWKQLHIDPMRQVQQWGCTWVSWQESDDPDFKRYNLLNWNALYLAFRVEAALPEEQCQYLIIQQRQPFEMYNSSFGRLLATDVVAVIKEIDTVKARSI